MDVNRDTPQKEEGEQSTASDQSSEKPAAIKEDSLLVKNQTLVPPAAAPEAITAKQPIQIEPMEVHHHAHAPHGKNKWKEYLFQFFMLFLAVLCGFLAEYQLEHVIEHQREKQFMKSMIIDVNSDINKLNSIVDVRMVRENRLDSLSLLMNSNLPNDATNNIYAIAIIAARSILFRFVPNDGTLQQLKNSGGFRLIRNRAVADSISRYDVTVRNFLHQGEIEETAIHDFRVAAAAIFDARVFDRMLDEDNNVRPTTDNPSLLAFDKRELYTWNYRMYTLKAINKANRRDARLLLRQAKNLLETLKNAYRLK